MNLTRRTLAWGCLGLGLLCFPVAASADDPVAGEGAMQLQAPPETVLEEPMKPLRHNFTVELGLGLAFGVLPGENRGIDPGFSIFAFSIGGFLNDWLALMYRGNLGLFYDGTVGELIGTQGVQLQFWPNDRLMLAIGGGLANTGQTPEVMERGFGLLLRAGYGLWQGERHTVRLAVEGQPMWFDQGFAFTQTLLLEWQAH